MIKRETKELGMETHPREGVMKEEKFPNTRKPAHQQDFGEFWNFRGQHNQERKKKKNPQITCLTTIPSGEVAQMLMSATSKRGLNREVRAALLRVRTGTECPEDNLRELA